MNELQRMIASQAGSPGQTSQDMYGMQPGQASAQAQSMLGGPEFAQQLEALRAKVYSGQPLTPKEKDVVTYLHGIVNQGQLNPPIEEPTFGGQMVDQMGQMGGNIRQFGEGKYNELLTRGKTTLDDIAGQAEQGLDAVTSMFDNGNGQRTEQLEIPPRQPSGDLEGVMEEMRGPFQFEQDLQNPVPRVPFDEEAEMTPERTEEWRRYIMQEMMRGNQ